MKRLSREKYEKKMNRTILHIVNRICYNLNLPEYIKKEVSMYYDEILKRKLTLGRSHDLLVSACIYLVCRKNQKPVFLNEISREVYLSSDLLKKTYKLLINEFNIKIAPIDPISYIPKVVNMLKLGFEIEKSSAQILMMVREKINTEHEKTILGFVGAIIYLVCKFNYEKISQKYICEAIGISEITLRKKCRLIEHTLKQKIS